MTVADTLLVDINRDLPSGVDWKAGARRYLADLFVKHDRASIELYSFIKPFVRLEGGPVQPPLSGPWKMLVQHGSWRLM